MDLWFTVAVIVVLVLSSSDASLQWKIATNPLVIGEAAIISCNGNNCLPRYTKKWFGGKNFDLLCSGNHSNNPSKYKMTTNGSTFDLIIKNLNSTDFNFEYTCACGFRKYTNMLMGNAEEVIYPPRVLQNSLTQTDNIFNIYILVEVYPRPKCMLLFEDQVLLGHILVRTVPNEIGLKLFEVAFHHTVVVPGGIVCNSNLTLNCKVGSNTYSVCRHNFNTCKDEDKPKEVVHLIMDFLAGIFPFIIFVLILFFFVKCSSVQCFRC